MKTTTSGEVRAISLARYAGQSKKPGLMRPDEILYSGTSWTGMASSSPSIESTATEPKYDAESPTAQTRGLAADAGRYSGGGVGMGEGVGFAVGVTGVPSRAMPEA